MYSSIVSIKPTYIFTSRIFAFILINYVSYKPIFQEELGTGDVFVYVNLTEDSIK